MRTHRQVAAVSADVHTPFDRVDGRKMFWQVAAVAAAFYLLSAEPSVLRALPHTSVLVHEQAHVAAALLTGGGASSVTIAENLSGQAVTAGGLYAAVVFAGYTAPVLLGALWLLGSSRRHYGTWVAGLTFLAALAMQLVPMDTWTRMVAAALAGVAGLIALLSWDRWFWPLGSFTLRLLGTYWCIVGISDLWSDCFASAAEGSDIVALGRWSNLPARWVGAAWLLALVAVSLVAAVRSLQLTPVKVVPVVR